MDDAMEILDRAAAAAYQKHSEAQIERSGRVQELSPDLLREIAGGLAEQPG